MIMHKVARIPRWLWFAAGTVIVIPLVIICRLFKCWCLIRFGYFTVDRIGHFAFDVEYFLSERILQSETHKAIDLFFFDGVPVNSQLVKMSRRQLFVSPVIRFFYLANELLPGGAVHKILPARHQTASRDKHGVFHKVSTQLCFTKLENRQGEDYLKKIGCSNKTKFVCLIVRDSAYLKQFHPGRDWSYHDFRDTQIEDYEEAALALADQGYWVLRMGKVVRRPLLVEHPKIIDYANREDRNDFLDVWLVAHSYFAISTGLGLDSVADIFRRPQVFVNYLPLMDMEAWGPYITVPKVLIWSVTGQSLTLNEYIRHTSVNAHYYSDQGITVRDLSPSDIKDAVLEMESRQSGTWTSNESEDLQEKFWDAIRASPDFSRYHSWIHPNARIGTKFIENFS